MSIESIHEARRELALCVNDGDREGVDACAERLREAKADHEHTLGKLERLREAVSRAASDANLIEGDLDDGTDDDTPERITLGLYEAEALIRELRDRLQEH